jgi:hypothetical protein
MHILEKASNGSSTGWGYFSTCSLRAIGFKIVKSKIKIKIKIILHKETERESVDSVRVDLAGRISTVIS